MNTILNDGSQSAILRNFDEFNNVLETYEYDYVAAPPVGQTCQGAPGG